MKKFIFFLILLATSPVLAQTSTTNTTTTTNTGTTNATVTSPGNVVVSTPNGTIGNQVNSPANNNNVYVITPNQNASGFNGQHYQQYNNLSEQQREEIDQRRYERDYDRAQSQHDYRDRANYYNIRRNDAIQSDNGGNGVSETTRRNYQADYHSSYPSYYHNHH